MKKLYEYARSGYHLIFLLAFVLLFAWATRFTVPFGDDFYYATFVRSGWKYFISENVFHYMNTNGRAWVHLLDELLLATDGMWAFKLFNTAAAALLTVAVAKTASDGKAGFRPALAASCVLFSLITIQNAYQSVFWATGAMNYLFPMLLSLLYLLSLTKGGKLGYAAPALAFFASSSSEQAAFLALCATVFRGVMYIKERKRPNAVYITAAILSAVGFVLLFAAPGNSVRTGYYPDFYAMPLFSRIVYNLPILRDLVFSKAGAGDGLLAFFAVFSVRSLRRGSIPGKISAAAAFSGGAFYYALIHLGAPHAFVHVSAVMTVVSLAFCVAFTIADGRYTAAFAAVMAAALQFAMLLSPEMGPRTVLCSVILLMIPTAEFASDLLIPCGGRTFPTLLFFAAVLFAATLPGILTSAAVLALALAAVVMHLSEKTRKYAVFALALTVLLISADRMWTFVCGYGTNYPVHEMNAANVANYKKGDGEIEVYYLKDPDFKYIMPYENGYHEYWFKRCYGIDEETKIVYKNAE